MTHPRERWLLRLCAYQKFLTAALVRPGSMRAMAAGGSMQQHAGQQPRQLLAACLQERQRLLQHTHEASSATASPGTFCLQERHSLPLWGASTVNFAG